jgi:hypothetical protein
VTASEALQRLRADPQYQQALARARTPEERDLVVRLVESFVGGIVEAATRLATQADAGQLSEALGEKQRVVNEGASARTKR